jgi:hypothetical protein
LFHRSNLLTTTFHALPKLPHWRHDGCERSEDADGAIRAAIWGGDFSARHACVEQSRYAAVKSFLIDVIQTAFP